MRESQCFTMHGAYSEHQMLSSNRSNLQRLSVYYYFNRLTDYKFTAPKGPPKRDGIGLLYYTAQG